VWQMAEVVAYLRHLRLAGRIARREEAGGRFRYTQINQRRGAR
jgi:hypothetical protein